MPDYPYRMQLAEDAAAPGSVARNSTISFYAATDTAGTTLLALKDPSGNPLGNPLTTTPDGFVPALIAPVDEIRWEGGGFHGFLTSYEGLKAEAVSAVAAANAAAASAAGAAANAAEAVASALADAVGDAQSAAESAAAAAALVGAPADSAMSTVISAPTSATRTALNATYLDKTTAASTYAMVSAVPSGLGTGTSNVASQIQAILDSADTFGAEVYFPDGTYRVDAPLEKFHRIRMSKSATITAGAPGMTAVVRTRIGTRYDNGAITGGTIDANTNAAIGIHVRNFLYFKLNNVTINGGNVAAVKLGDSTAGGRAAEAVLSKLRLINNGNVVSGSRGILSENSGDHSFSQILIMNYEYGVTLPVANNAMLEDVHAWAEPAKGALKVGFEDSSNNSHYAKCHADSPTEAGWVFNGYQPTLVQCGTYLNPSVPQIADNTVVGIKFNAPNSIATIVGHFFFGGSGIKRLKADIEATDGNYGLIQTIGCSNQNVATTRTLYNRSIGQNVRDTVTAGKGFVADAPAPSNDIGMIIRTAGLDRWKLVTDGGAETGSNAGTGLALRSFSDTGALLSELLFISRASGTCVWKTNQFINDGFNIALGSTAGTKFGTSATQKMGFYGLAPVVQQSVTGARGSAAATASLNARLATLGLIADLTVSPVSTKTASYTITATDRYVIANNGTLTMTLPDPTLASPGYPVTIKNVNASNCTVASLASGLIDGAATVTLAQWGKVTVISDGTQWLTV